MTTGDPLPAYGFNQAPYAWGGPVASGQFKQAPQDFIVREVLGYEPSGAGEHLYVLIQTSNQNTRYTAKCIARHLQVKNRQVSFSGLKDRHGDTQQWFSVHLPGQNLTLDTAAMATQGIQVLRQQRHHKKLKVGTHKANGFQICMRQVEGDRPLIEKRLAQIQSHGVPNYFGPQRFGHDANNIAELNSWAEQGQLPADREMRSIVLSTLRAWMFNGRVAQRLIQQHWPGWQAQDIVMLAGTHSFFVPDCWTEELEQRLQAADIQIGEWLPGSESSGLEARYLELLKLASMKQEPRPIRLQPWQMQWRWRDEDLNIDLQLPTGAYATAVLREIF